MTNIQNEAKPSLRFMNLSIHIFSFFCHDIELNQAINKAFINVGQEYLNLTRCGLVYYKIPQLEGSFSHAKLKSNGLVG